MGLLGGLLAAVLVYATVSSGLWWFPALPAAGLLYMSFWSRRPSTVRWAAAWWILFMAWEAVVQLRFGCDIGGCIRLDVLTIVLPLLVVMSGGAARSCAGGHPGRHAKGGGHDGSG